MAEAPPFTETDQPPMGSDRAFGLVFAGVFVIIGFWPLLNGATPFWWSFVVSAVFAATALARPGLLHPLNRIWHRFGLLLHRFISPIVLGLVFFLVLTPTGLIMRLITRDPLNLEVGNAKSTYWHVTSERVKSRESLNNQF